MAKVELFGDRAASYPPPLSGSLFRDINDDLGNFLHVRGRELTVPNEVRPAQGLLSKKTPTAQ
jgi:hypothetical protein